MTIKAVEWALKREGISATAKLVLIMLCDCINAGDEVAFPSQRRISEVVGRKERQVRRHIDSLERAGLISVIAGAGAGRGKGRQPDRYAIACDHRTGQERVLSQAIISKCGAVTGGHSRPAVVDTGGHIEHPVTVTGGHSGQLQAVISGRAYIEEPEIEPERVSASPERELVASLFLSPDKPATAKPALDGRSAIDAYNASAARCGWCAAKGDPSAARKQAIRARLRAHGMEGWREQLALAETIPFLAGENERGWRMGLDFFASPRGWANIAEGKYVTHRKAAHDQSPGNADPGVRRRQRSALTERAMRLMAER